MDETNHHQTSTPDAENTGELRTQCGLGINLQELCLRMLSLGAFAEGTGDMRASEVKALLVPFFGADCVARCNDILCGRKPAPAPSEPCDMRHCPVCKPKATSETPDECDDLATLQRVERELAEARAEIKRLAVAIQAATVLIAAKGRHNTMLAYNGLRAAIAAVEDA